MQPTGIVAMPISSPRDRARRASGVLTVEKANGIVNVIVTPIIEHTTAPAYRPTAASLHRLIASG